MYIVAKRILKCKLNVRNSDHRLLYCVHNSWKILETMIYADRRLSVLLIKYLNNVKLDRNPHNFESMTL